MHHICTTFTVLLQFAGGYYSRDYARWAEEFRSICLVPPPRWKSPTTYLLSACPALPRKPRIHAEVGRYRLRLAQTVEDRDAACRLRFKVFNIELGEGLESSYQTGLDTDQFDPSASICWSKTKLTRRIVGTYRMQSGETAARNLGYYSEQEFNFAPYEPLRSGILELGRASIDREHRTPEVLTLLWRGIAQYATDMGLRYLVGCSSLNSKDPAEGWQMYRQLEHYRVSPEFETVPTAAYACPTEQEGAHAQPSPCDTECYRLPVAPPRFPSCSRPIWPLARASALRRPGTASSAPSISLRCSI